MLSLIRWGQPRVRYGGRLTELRQEAQISAELGVVSHYCAPALGIGVRTGQPNPTDFGPAGPPVTPGHFLSYANYFVAADERAFLALIVPPSIHGHHPGTGSTPCRGFPIKPCFIHDGSEWLSTFRCRTPKPATSKSPISFRNGLPAIAGFFVTGCEN